MSRGDTLTGIIGGASGTDGLGDLAAVDALRIGRRDAEVAVSRLALDHHRWNAFARHLGRVSVPELVRREPVPHPGGGGGAPQ